MEQSIKLWILCNRKELSEAEFQEKVGTSFNEFFKKNHHVCQIAWNKHHKNIKLKDKIPKRAELLQEKRILEAEYERLDYRFKKFKAKKDIIENNYDKKLDILVSKILKVEDILKKDEQK